MAVGQTTISDPEDWDALAQRWLTNAARFSAMQSKGDAVDLDGVSVERETLSIGIVASGDGWAKAYLEIQGHGPENDLTARLFSVTDVTLPEAEDLDGLFMSDEFADVQQRLRATEEVDVQQLKSIKLEPDVEEALIRAGAMAGDTVTGWAIILHLLLTQPEIYTFAQSWWEKPPDCS